MFSILVLLGKSGLVRKIYSSSKCTKILDLSGLKFQKWNYSMEGLLVRSKTAFIKILKEETSLKSNTKMKALQLKLNIHPQSLSIKVPLNLAGLKEKSNKNPKCKLE
jgi:hypothetical protein